MKTYSKHIQKLTAPSITKNIDKINEKKKGNSLYKISTNINPYNLFLYLFSRFGKPNGLLSVVRKEDSDQLFHWHYTLLLDDKQIEIMCATHRIEVFIADSIVLDKNECINFLHQLISDTKNYRKEATQSRKEIEEWEMIFNPFKRIQRQIDILVEEVEKTNSSLASFEYTHTENIPINNELFTEWSTSVEEISAKTFAIKCLIPIYIETFINFIIEVLIKKEIKDNKEQFNTIIRNNIHIKIQNLHLNCSYFHNNINWEDDICKNIHSIFNRRNDLLHGNFRIKELKYGEVGFIKNMPLFKSISSWQDEILTLGLSNGDIKDAIKELEDAQEFMMYVLLSIDPRAGKQIKLMLENSTLGFNKKTKRFGILFTDNFVDLQAYVQKT